MQIVLFEPEIPPNTGNIARLSAALGLPLHLIGPLGFSLDDKYLKRAGLDYWPHVSLKIWNSFEEYLDLGRMGHRLVMTSSRGGNPIQKANFTREDALVFGPETRGLPQEITGQADMLLRLSIKDVVRSINLSTAVGIFVYQAMAQSGMLDEI